MRVCKRCSAVPCLCKDGPLITPPLYQDSSTCPAPQICSEFVYTGCVTYNGPELTQINIFPGMDMNQVIQTLVIYDIAPECVTTPCSAPLITVIRVTSTTIDIGWSLCPDCEDTAIYTVSYMVEDASPATWNDLTSVIAPTSHQVITGLECETIYLIKVAAEYSDHTCESLIIRVTTETC